MILNYGLIAVLGLGSLSLTSCKKDKEITLQAYQNVNLHLAKFSLSKEIKEKDKDGKEVLKQDKSIASAFFSIENAKGEGVLTNVKPLPYATKLENIRLDIVPMLEDVKIEVSLDSGATFEEWKRADKKTFTLTPQSDKLKIRLSTQTAGQNSETFAYTYQVKIQVYKFDPQTIHWSKLATPTSDVLETKQFETYTLANGQMCLMSIDKGNKTNKFYKLNTEAKAFEDLAYPSLGASSYIKELKNYKDDVFALSSNGKVYRLRENNTWEALNLDASALLGVFALRNKGAEPILALVVEENGVTYFASYDVAKKQLDKGEKLDEAFPLANYKTLSTFSEGVGANLLLVGANGLTYTSTNGTAWAKIAVAESPIDKSFAFVQNGDLLYRFVAKAEGLELFTKENAQLPWLKNGAVAFKPAEGQSFDVSSFADSPIALWVKGQSFYLYKGGASPSLYQGDLKKNAI